MGAVGKAEPPSAFVSVAVTVKDAVLGQVASTAEKRSVRRSGAPPGGLHIAVPAGFRVGSLCEAPGVALAVGLAPKPVKYVPFDGCPGCLSTGRLGVREPTKGLSGVMEARRMAESQLSELQNMRVLLEEARALARDLAYHRRARLETSIGQALDEVERQIEDLRRYRS